MADTADLRSEGKNSQTTSARYSRLRARSFELASLCKYCGDAVVKNRKVCYECSAKQSVHTYRSGLRYFLKLAGAKLDQDTEQNADKILNFLIREAQYIRNDVQT